MGKNKKKNNRGGTSQAAAKPELKESGEVESTADDATSTAANSPVVETDGKLEAAADVTDAEEESLPTATKTRQPEKEPVEDDTHRSGGEAAGADMEAASATPAEQSSNTSFDSNTATDVQALNTAAEQQLTDDAAASAPARIGEAPFAGIPDAEVRRDDQEMGHSDDVRAPVPTQEVNDSAGVSSEPSRGEVDSHAIPLVGENDAGGESAQTDVAADESMSTVEIAAPIATTGGDLTDDPQPASAESPITAQSNPDTTTTHAADAAASDMASGNNLSDVAQLTSAESPITARSDLVTAPSHASDVEDDFAALIDSDAHSGQNVDAESGGAELLQAGSGEASGDGILQQGAADDGFAALIDSESGQTADAIEAVAGNSGADNPEPLPQSRDFLNTPADEFTAIGDAHDALGAAIPQKAMQIDNSRDVGEFDTQGDDFAALVNSEAPASPPELTGSPGMPSSVAALISTDAADHDADDAFAQLAREDEADAEAPVAEASLMSSGNQHPAADQADEFSFIAAQNDGQIEVDTQDDFSALLAASDAPAAEDTDAAAAKWADLMDEFEELADTHLGDPQDEPTRQASPKASTMFDDDASDFDQILQSAQEEIRHMASQHPEPSTLPSGPAEQSTSARRLFADDGDDKSWLNDTSVDQSFPLDDQPSTSGAMASGSYGTEGEAVDVDVPEGWMDDDGTFRYYTPEEKAAVRASMVGDRGTVAQENSASADPYGVTQRSSGSFYGNAGLSENAARRTPQPEEQSQTTASTQSYDPYAPVARTSSVQAAAQSSLITPAVQAGFVPAPPAIESYTPAAVPQASSSSYDPYAPSPAGYPAPYASASRSVPSSLTPNPPPVAKPAPPMRVASNAYDPPLKPQKSFVRAKPVAPAPAMSPAPPSFPLPTSLARATPPPGPPPAPAAPPPGPPRRAPSVPPPPPQAPPSRPASAFVPPPPVLAVQEHATSGDDEQNARHYLAPTPAPQPGPPRGPPSRPPSSAAQRKTPKTPVYSSFDPPLKPTSVSRPTSRASQRPAFEAPPPVPPLPPMQRARSPLSSANVYADENAARSSQPSRVPPPPGRPLSRAAAPTLPPAEGTSPNAPSSRALPPRIAPPPGPPPRQPTPETPAEDLHQGSGVPSSKGWPHLAGEEDEEGFDAEEVTTAPRGQKPDFGEDEVDPEGGEDWGQDELDGFAGTQDGEPRSHSPTRDMGQRPSFGGQARLSPQSSLGLRDDVEDLRHGGARDSSELVASAPTRAPPPPGPPPGPPLGVARQMSSVNYNPYGPGTGSGAAVPAISPVKARPPIPSPFMATSDIPSDPYAPSSAIPTTGQVSQAYASAIPHPSTQSSTHDSPYGAPPKPSNNTYAPYAAAGSDPYARVESPVQSHDNGSSLDTAGYFQSAPADTSYVPQQVLEQRPVSEDPLGRGSTHAKNVPLAVFGFGGVLVTSFPAQATEQEDAHRQGHARAPSYGYASVRGKIWIRGIAELASSSAIKSDDELVFPGPLLYDTATKGAAAEKKKRETLMAYLEGRAAEIERGLPYLKSASATTGASKRREEEGKVVLIRVLAAMMLDEGKDGRKAYDEGLVKALSNAHSAPLLSPNAATFNATSSAYGLPNKAANAPSAPSSSQMSTLVDLLSTGNKREAAEYAARHALWSHALVIASSVGPDLWRDTVKSFASAELTGEGMGGIKAAYMLFAGSGGPSADAVDELFAAANIGDDPTKDQWKEVIGSIVLNGQSADAAHLDELGARFARKGLRTAASVCYLLSSSSPFADPSPNAVNKPIAILDDTREEDAIIFAEIAEYARSLLPVPKGQEVPFAGLPRLLPYKLQRAWLAAEIGDVELAQRYCQAVESASKAIKNGPALLSSQHTASMEDLMERLTGSPSVEPAKNLSARKATAKPGLDKLGSWLEGRLTKFIAGDDEAPAAVAKPIPATKDKSAPVGPFSHFASISPARSADVSRNPSVPDFGASGSVSSINGLLSAGPLTTNGRSSPLGQPSTGYNYSQGSPSSKTTSLQGYSPFQPSTLTTAEEEPASDNGGDEEVGELLNPMAALSFGAPPAITTSHSAPHRDQVDLDDDDDDLGFGNAGLSRNRTPRPPTGPPQEQSGSDAKQDEYAPAEEVKQDKGKEKESPTKDAGGAPKKGWLSGWFAKKEEGTGPVRAKLGDENAMVFDPDLKRWVVKGQKPEAAPAAPPPPPRSSTATPAASFLSGGPPSGTPPTAFNTIPRVGSSSGPPAGGPPAGPPTRAPSAAPPGPPGSRPPSAVPPGPGAAGLGPPKPKGAAPSIDDLLSRPTSKRPGSAAARKGAKNRYVDVFQQPQ